MSEHSENDFLKRTAQILIKANEILARAEKVLTQKHDDPKGECIRDFADLILMGLKDKTIAKEDLPALAKAFGMQLEECFGQLDVYEMRALQIYSEM